MYKEKKKNNIFKRIVAFLGATFTAIACFFAFNLNVDDEKINVYADQIETTSRFIGSNLFLPISPFLQNITDYRSEYTTDMMFYFEFNYVYDYEGVDSFINSILFSTTLLDFGFNASWFYSLDELEVAGDNKYTDTFYSFTDGDLSYRYRYDIICSNPVYINGFEGNYIQMGVPIGFELFSEVFGTGYVVTSLKYFDSEMRYVQFQFYTHYSYFKTLDNEVVANNFAFTPRIYYFSNSFDLNDNQFYSLGYNEGLTTGYNNGFTQGENKGYSDGYTSGKNAGYNLGKNEVLNDLDIFSFNNLLTSVIDVPVKAFTSLFNFEILGINLSGFFTGLLTMGVVIAIVRLLMGR